MNCSTKNLSSKLTIAVVLIIYFCYTTTEARPSEDLSETSNTDWETPVDPSLYNGDLTDEVIRQIQKCENDLELMELCLRCAKETKSEIVYPMCCGNQDSVKEWCYQYIFYGASPSSL